MRPSASDPASVTNLAQRIDAALPQTQCTRCGYPDCSGYAEAIATGQADINRCPPGGAEGIARLAAITGHPPLPLDPARGVEGPRRLAVIDEGWCIGCTLCIKACPVDCIVGASKFMHVVISAQCTGCELCLPVCPVDCISMEPLPAVTGAPVNATGWQAWSTAHADAARARYVFHVERGAREQHDDDARLAARAAEKLADRASHSRVQGTQAPAQKRALVEAALARAPVRAPKSPG